MEKSLKARRLSRVLGILYFVSLAVLIIVSSAFTASAQGGITPEGLQQLLNNPAFQGLSPEEILKAKTQFETQKKDTTKQVLTPQLIVSPKEFSDFLFLRYRRIKGYQEINLNLKPFGSELFEQAAVTLETPTKGVPVSDDYVVGPGDEVKLLFWGRVNAQYDLTVDKDGNITIPQLGPLQVAGMRFREMNEYLKSQSEQIIGANVNITLGQLKTITVFVLGDARRPGSYVVNSFATIMDVVQLAGGPSSIGTYRNIKLMRGGQTATTFDLYDLLLKGDKSKDLGILAGDVIYFPVAGPLVGIAGNVKRPAIYELKDKDDLASAVELAGGVTPTASLQQVQVDRIVHNMKGAVLDIDARDSERMKKFMLQDADLVKIFNITLRDENTVFLNGNLYKPGEYEYKDGLRLRDIIKVPEDLMPDTYTKYALIKRITAPDYLTRLVPFTLDSLFAKDDTVSNIRLEALDQIFIFHRDMFFDKPHISISGEVREPKTDIVPDKNTRIKDAIFMAGGLMKNAYLPKGELFRIDENHNIIQIYFNVEKALAGDSLENILLQDRDRVVIHSIYEEQYAYFVSVNGEVLRPAQYPLTQDMRVSDLVFAAGNVLESAYLEEAEISQRTIDPVAGMSITHITINLKKALENDPANNLLLQPGDGLLIKRLPNWGEVQYITLSGEVKFPGAYIIRKGEKLSSVITRAGGYTEQAYLKGANFTRVSVKEIQFQRLKQSLAELENLATGGTTAMGAGAVDSARIAQQQAFLEQIAKLKPSGRVYIKLSPLAQFTGSAYDFVLESGDELAIPPNPSTVQVLGAVYSPMAFIYESGKKVPQYVKSAGGYLPKADKRDTYILKVDGSAYNTRKTRVAIDPGDIVIIPEKTEVKVNAWEGVKNVADIMYKTGISAASIVAVLKLLGGL